jgi:hypothetical protein
MKTSGSKLGVRMGMGKGSPRTSGVVASSSHADSASASSSTRLSSDDLGNSETVRGLLATWCTVPLFNANDWTHLLLLPSLLFCLTHAQAKKQAEDLAFSDDSLGYYEVDQAFGFLSNLERQMNPDDPKLQLLLGNPYAAHEEEEKVRSQLPCSLPRALCSHASART